MLLKGKRKAALLLMGLEPATAAELLKSAEPEVITQIAAELASLDTSRHDPAVKDDDPMREFSEVLKGAGGQSSNEAFIKEILQGAIGTQKSDEVLSRIDNLVQMRDPFRMVRDCEVKKIADALRGESAQVSAMVLSELPPKKSAALLPMLEDNVRAEAVTGMAGGEEVSPDAKLRVALAVENRLRGQDEGKQTVAAPVDDKGKEERLRKVSVLLRGLKVEFRDELIDSLSKQDEQTAKEVQRLMVVWEDLFVVPERALQEALRTSDSRQLALALVGADEAVGERIKSNISERASTMLDEETSLLSSPKDEEIQGAREAILEALRKMNEEGELEFVERQ